MWQAFELRPQLPFLSWYGPINSLSFLELFETQENFQGKPLKHKHGRSNTRAMLV